MLYQDLKSKKVLITGVSRGIGNSMAKVLAKNKCHLVINYRKKPNETKEVPENITNLIKELKNLGAIEVDALEFDLLNIEKMQSVLKEYSKNNSPITGIINNAGVSKDQLILRLNDKDLSNTIDINLKSSMLLVSTLSRSFLREKDVSIINISSIVGLMGNPAQSAYSASKAGMIGFTKSLAKELGSKKIRVNCICPGFIKTDMTESLDQNIKENYLSSIPLGEFGENEDVANLACFLLSTASRYITGEVIKIDGGLYI